jgi:hypothetical protein
VRAPVRRLTAKTDYPTGASPTSLALADLSGDGEADLVTTDLDTNAVSVLLGKGDGTFAAKADYATGASPIAVALGDLNRDGFCSRHSSAGLLFDGLPICDGTKPRQLGV